MKTLFSSLLSILLLSGCAHAQSTVYFSLQQMTGSALNRRISIVPAPAQNPRYDGGKITAQAVPLVLTPTNGLATNSFLAGDYLVALDGVPGTIKMSVPGDSATYNATDLMQSLPTYIYTNPSPALVQGIVGSNLLAVFNTNMISMVGSGTRYFGWGSDTGSYTNGSTSFITNGVGITGTGLPAPFTGWAFWDGSLNRYRGTNATLVGNTWHTYGASPPTFYTVGYSALNQNVSQFTGTFTDNGGYVIADGTGMLGAGMDGSGILNVNAATLNGIPPAAITTNGGTFRGVLIGTNGLSLTNAGAWWSGITNNGIVWFSCQTNNTPSITGPPGSVALLTNGMFYIWSNSAWARRW